MKLMIIHGEKQEINGTQLLQRLCFNKPKLRQVIPIYNYFAERFPDPSHFIRSYNKTKKNIFEGLGLTWRNEILYKTADYIDKNGVPNNYQELLKVPGIGDYVASAVLSFHMNKRAVLIDSNIVRFYCRFFWL